MTKFEGRFYIIDDCLTNLKCWVYEFEPMTLAKRSSEEWAEAHLQECYDAKQLRELFGLPADSDLQVLFTADINGKMSYGPDGDDYNEWLDVEKVAYQRVPEEFAGYTTPQVQELTNEEEPQRPQEAISREVCQDTNIEHVRFSLIAEITIQQAIESFNKAHAKSYRTSCETPNQANTGKEYHGLLAKDLSEAVAKGLTPTKCKGCSGTGLHPCSAKSRNTDDDTCPRCKGTGIEPSKAELKARKIDSRPANLSDIDYGH